MLDNHPIVAPGGLERNVAVADVPQYGLRIALERTPESTTSAGEEPEPIAGLQPGRCDFAGGGLLPLLSTAHEFDLICSAVTATAQSPWRADRPLYLRLEHGGHERF